MTEQARAAEQAAAVLYQAEPAHTAMVQQIQEQIHRLCHGHMHRPVRVHTMDGQVYEGYIAHVDRCLLYLHCTVQDPRAFIPPQNAILPLVLYELLVITLLYT
ncbi:hypothetical protein [Paenibacillus sp. KS-LC4]|uniref:hypothetical protein n=1 Tax=Paenibacillus sp. KS-LC4 TaxID=2979727 RepID=UPI0030D0D2BB